MKWLRGYAYSMVMLGWNRDRAKVYADMARDGFVQSVHGWNRK